MALVVNTHVQRLRRFQPFQPDSGELIYEQSAPSEPDQWFEMSVLGALEDMIEDASVRMIVLTGDAGHGKTSLCARVLQDLGSTPEEARAALGDRGDGLHTLAPTRSGRELRVLKDLSDVSPDAGADLVGRMLKAPEQCVSIVCANEGRMRRVVGAHPEGLLHPLTATLERGLWDGTVSDVQHGLRVINLNYQSVAPDGQEGLVDGALRAWAADGRHWRACTRCDAQEICPILANHRSLSDATHGSSRRAAIRALFATAERSGAVVTTRQALATLALCITGGLQCSDVHLRWQRGSTDRTWQHPFSYHQSVFADHLGNIRRLQVPVLATLRRLDPGRVALRQVDDALEVAADAADFLPPLPTTDEGSPKSRREAQRESDLLRSVVRFLRRREFFEAPGEGPSLMQRMGFKAGDDFLSAATNGLGDSLDVRDRLLRGLEAVQGVVRPAKLPDFLVVDPAFSVHRSRAVVVAQRIANRNVTVLPQREHWSSWAGMDPELPRVLDWTDRMTVLRVAGSDVAISIDLFRFELLSRWAAGLSSRVQHEAEVRHFTNALAELVPAGEISDEITVLVGGERRTLVIDVGDVIRSGEG